jgi:alkylation response protein AidB-like acyl-CoA dehydrogenase
MYFDLTDDQKAIRDAVTDLLRDKIDDQGALRLFNSGRLDQELWQSLAGLGLGSILVPQDQGGLGMDFLTLAMVADALARFGAPGLVTRNALAAWLVATAADDACRRRWLEDLASGKAIAAFALLEPGGGWLSNDWSLQGARVSGTKTCVEWGSHADVFIVGLSGGQLSLIDAKSPGVTVTAMDSLDRGCPLADVAMAEVEASPLAGERLGERLVDALLVLLAAEALGSGVRAYEMAVEYAKIRTQFGKVIGRFQALKHQLANMAVDMEPCRALYWYAAHAWNSLPEQSTRAAAIAKAHITEVAVKTARAAVEAHGGIGYTWEYPLHVFLKRAMYARAAMGAPPLHRERMAVLASW